MEGFITLVCPSCGGKTAFSTDSNLFQCEYCGNRHAFNLPSRQVAPDRPHERPRPLMPRPKTVRIQKKEGGLEISWRWFAPKYIPLAFFCVAWDSFLIFWYGMAFSMLSSGSFAWIMVVFPIAHLAVGIGLTYATLAGFLNTSTLRVDSRGFSVQHDPLPWTGEVKLPVSALDQFYCQHKHKSGDDDSSNYTLSAALKDGRKIELLQNLDAPDIGVFIEQQLETWLEIPDRRMAGEVGI